jgi:hypothetical protein
MFRSHSGPFLMILWHWFCVVIWVAGFTQTDRTPRLRPSGHFSIPSPHRCCVLGLLLCLVGIGQKGTVKEFLAFGEFSALPRLPRLKAHSLAFHFRLTLVPNLDSAGGCRSRYFLFKYIVNQERSRGLVPKRKRYYLSVGFAPGSAFRFNLFASSPTHLLHQTYNSLSVSLHSTTPPHSPHPAKATFEYP